MPPGITSLPAALRVRVPGRSGCGPGGRSATREGARQGRAACVKAQQPHWGLAQTRAVNDEGHQSIDSMRLVLT